MSIQQCWDFLKTAESEHRSRPGSRSRRRSSRRSPVSRNGRFRSSTSAAGGLCSYLPAERPVLAWLPRRDDVGASHRAAVKPERLLRRLATGGLSNVHFEDFVRLVEGVGFELLRVSGRHHVFIHPEVREILSLQNAGGEAKPYQIRQFLRLVERYDLKVEKP